MSSPAGNRTPVSRVTGGDTDHYRRVFVRSQILTSFCELTVDISSIVLIKGYLYTLVIAVIFLGKSNHSEHY